MPSWNSYFQALEDEMINEIRTLAEIESFTPEIAHVNQMADAIEARFKALGAQIERIKPENAGDIILGKWFTDIAQKPILILTHMDTVHPIGTLAEFPVRVEDGKLYGPGTLDMKGGIVTALTAIEGLIKEGVSASAPIWFLATSDEETSSRASRGIIEEIAAQCSLVLVMEPGMPSGDLKLWRKGGGDYTVRVKGRPAHAGIEPEAGINAIVEMAKQTLTLDTLNNFKAGTSVSVTMIQGGTARNVIPALVQAKIDFRAVDQRNFDATHAEIMRLEPNMPGAEVEVEFHGGRPPMEFNAGNQAAFEQCKQIASKLNIPLKADGTGGMSDANFTSAMGIPTLDGLGPIGAGAHTLNEYLSIASLTKRAALLAAILSEWSFSS